MERMTKVDENIQTAQNLLSGIVERCYELEEENKKLNKQIEQFKKGVKAGTKIIERLEIENKKLKEKNEKLEEDNINLISFNEHYSPDVIVKYEDRYETAYNEECIENAKLCDKMRRLEEENRKLKDENKKLKHENSYRAGIVDILPKGKGHIAEETIQDLQARINELKETIKDHQLYEEKLEHRIIEFEELLHGE